MNRYLSSLTTALLVFTLVGCNNPLSIGGQNPVLIKTDKTQYHFSEDDSVKVSITNQSSETIFYSTCFGKTIEVLHKDKVIETLGTPVCYCLCPAELKPGESIPVRLSSLSTEYFNHQKQNLLSDESLTFRIRYSFYYDEAFGDEPFPENYSRTNKFIIDGIEK